MLLTIVRHAPPLTDGRLAGRRDVSADIGDSQMIGRVRARLRGDAQIIASPAIIDIRTIWAITDQQTAAQNVIPLTAGQRIIALPASKIIIPAKAFDDVICRSGDNRIGSIVNGDGLSSRSGVTTLIGSGKSPGDGNWAVTGL